MMSKTPVRLGNFSDKRASNDKSIVIAEFRFRYLLPYQNIIQLFLDDTIFDFIASFNTVLQPLLRECMIYYETCHCSDNIIKYIASLCLSNILDRFVHKTRYLYLWLNLRFTSVDVESLFSMYKNILSDTIVSLTSANLKKYMILENCTSYLDKHFLYYILMALRVEYTLMFHIRKSALNCNLQHLIFSNIMVSHQLWICTFTWDRNLNHHNNKKIS
ncbi:hypothetical protein AGLY_008696 [Aphis glycines]|uniref:Uncharacterized protein n=1 Tax=Aphis glycines TaxID=307491 RepID=A0A6G0TKF6_APHGL|nr:hypothetical protein AGLY_008696 [Aphis glycines]